MNLKTKLAATFLMIGSASMAQAGTYAVEGIFAEPMVMGNSTVFNGTFDWDFGQSDTANISGLNLVGMMNSSMAVPSSTPNLTLTNYFSTETTISSGIVTASVFLNSSTDVYLNGGYDPTVETVAGMPFSTKGFAPNPNPENAFFKFSFDTTGGMISDTGLTTMMQYGDCTPQSLMSSGSLCMTGFGDVTGTMTMTNPNTGMEMTMDAGDGSMSGYAQSLSISEVSAVPVPAAAWLFGGALVSLFGANRRKNVLPA